MVMKGLCVCLYVPCVWEVARNRLNSFAWCSSVKGRGAAGESCISAQLLTLPVCVVTFKKMFLCLSSFSACIGNAVGFQVGENSPFFLAKGPRWTDW